MNQGLKLAALYAYGCQKTRELGIDEELKDFIISGRDEQKIKSYLRKLEPFLHYRLIAKANNINDPFDEQVVRAYWLGSTLLEKVKPELLKDLADEVDSSTLLKANYLISGGKTHHNFAVLAQASLKMKQLLERVNLCLISWGQVIECHGDELTVYFRPVVLKGKKFIFGSRKQKKIKRGLLKKISVGDMVSIHFNEAREVLNADNLKRLKKYTQEAIQFFN